MASRTDRRAARRLRRPAPSSEITMIGQDAAAMMMKQRFRAQLLSGRRARTVDDVVERLLAVQAQDPRGARLAVRARTTGLTARDVDKAFDEGRVVVTWLNRGTLHLVRSEDYWWLQQLTTPQLLTGTERRLGQVGVSAKQAERGVGIVEKALADDGPLTRAQLRERLGRGRIPTAGQALVHVLMLSALRGVSVRGPMAGKEQAFALVRDWLGEPPRVMDREQALGLLVRRYLAGHRPATERDLAKWANLPLRDVRRGVAAAGDALLAGDDGLLVPVGTARRGGTPPARLLGAFDPVLLGWTSRAEILGEHQHLVTVNGLFRPFTLVAGRCAGTWSLRGGRVVVEPLERIAAADAAALERDARDVERFLRP